MPITEVSSTPEFLLNKHYVTKTVTLDATAWSDDKYAKAGTVVGIVTASGKAVPYNDSNTDGSEVAVGILLENVDLNNGDQPAAIIIHGFVDKSKLVGYDAACEADLPLIYFE
ncbi:MAG: head decoration protein [Candidatus Cloacimonetes bacterium]|nr:head decoration protein [Candidatus Cloacimonadota bacterium]